MGSHILVAQGDGSARRRKERTCPELTRQFGRARLMDGPDETQTFLRQFQGQSLVGTSAPASLCRLGMQQCHRCWGVPRGRCMMAPCGVLGRSQQCLHHCVNLPGKQESHERSPPRVVGEANGRRLEVVADGFPLFGGQAAIDTTVGSTLHSDGRGPTVCCQHTFGGRKTPQRAAIPAVGGQECEACWWCSEWKLGANGRRNPKLHQPIEHGHDRNPNPPTSGRTGLARVPCVRHGQAVTGTLHTCMMW